jgi:dCTP deaminase
MITPILSWERQAAEGNASIDVRLGQRFVIPKRARIEKLDHLSSDHLQNLELYKDTHHVLIGEHFVLHPRQFVLGETLEWIHLPRGYAAFVIGRSSWGRDGLIIATATGIHPGFSGILTLEITNLGEIPIYLYPGLTIAQLFVHTVEHEGTETYVASAHAGDTKASNTDAAGDDKEIIKKIGRDRGITRWNR